MNITHALAAEALGLGNPDTVMREYCSGRREPSDTTRLHMDMLETMVEVNRALGNRDLNRACALVEHALSVRNLADITTAKESPCLTK